MGSPLGAKMVVADDMVAVLPMSGEQAHPLLFLLEMSYLWAAQVHPLEGDFVGDQLTLAGNRSLATITQDRSRLSVATCSSDSVSEVNPWKKIAGVRSINLAVNSGAECMRKP